MVDATTNKPLGEVVIKDLKTLVINYSNNDGHFTVSSTPVHLQLSRIGYATLRVTREEVLLEQLDTIRLLPKAIVLEDITVRPSKQIRVTAVPVTERSKNIFGVMSMHGLLPGAKMGVLLFPPDTTTTYRLNSIIVSVPKTPGLKAKSGRLRVRLVNVEASPNLHPGQNDLLSTAVIYSAKQVSEAPNQELEVDISAFGIKMPKQGICVVAECLPTEVSEVFVSINQKGQGKKLVVEVITATDPKNPATYRATPAQDFFFIGTATAKTTAVTWRTKRSGGWIKTSQSDFADAPDSNVLLDLLIEPEN